MARILIAEDDANIYKLITYRLTHLGHGTIRASDGLEALTLARDEHPDLILLDVMMPFATGFEVLRSIKRDPAIASIPVIMVTARGQEDEMELAIREGAHSYVVKP